MNPSQRSFFSSGTVIVPAGATVPYNCTGQMFVCKEATAPFWISFNDGEFFKHEVGLGFRLKGDDEFTKLQFRNDSADAITIEFYAGAGEVVDNRLNTTIERLIILGVKDVPTYTKATASIPAGTTVFSGADGGHQRKQFILSNPTATPLNLLDGNDAMFDAVSQDRWTVETSGTIKVQNSSGSAVAAYVLEIFYSS